ncbi:hypothetical protein Tco_0997345 [Tanacetum coccineum]
MGTIDNMKSTLTQPAFDALCEKFHIPFTVHPELPGRNNRIRNSPPEVCDFLATHPAMFWKFLESFVCLVGISRYYELDDNVYLVFLADDDEEIDLGHVVPLPGVNEQGNPNDDVQDVGIHVVNDEGVADDQENPIDAGIVCIEDEVPAVVVEKAKGSRKKRKTTRGTSGSNLPPKKLRAYHGTSGDDASTGGKSIAALQGLLERSTFPVKVGVTAVFTLPFITSSVSLTSKRVGGGRTDSVIGPYLHTKYPAMRFVVLSDYLCHSSSNAAGVEVSFVVRSLIPDPPIITTAVATTVIVAAFFVLVPRHTMSRFMKLRGMDYDQLFAEFNVGAARQTCLGVEVRMQIEHILREKKKLEGRCNRQADFLKERDVEIANLKAQLSLKEDEVTEAIHLRSQVAIVEATEAARVNELNGLKERNSALEEEKNVLEKKVTALEFVDATKGTELASLTAQVAKLTQDLSELDLSCDELHGEVLGYKLFKEKIEVVQDEQVKVLSDRVAGLDAELMVMALHLDEEFYPSFLTTLPARRWILCRGLRLVVMKCLQSLGYLAALGGAIDRAIIRLESQKDASIADIMGLFHLEGPAIEALEASQL